MHADGFPPGLPPKGQNAAAGQKFRAPRNYFEGLERPAAGLPEQWGGWRIIARAGLRSMVGADMVLAALSNRLHATRTFAEAIATILDDVIAFHGAEYGNVQLPVGDELIIVAQRGLSAAFLRRFARVRKEDGCACGQAFRLRRTVVISDVGKDPEFAPYLKDAESAGFRAVQTTPLFTGDGQLLGMVSNHFANIHEPTPFEIEILRSYSVVAAEHAYGLLGKRKIAEEAEKMNALLCASMLSPTST